MTYSRTLAQLKLSVQRRWQIDNSPDFTGNGGAMLTEMINDAIVEAHDLVIQKWMDYFTTVNQFSTTAGVDTYSLQTISAASDFYKLRKLEVKFGTRWRRLLPHDLEGSHHFISQGSGDKRYRYRIQGSNLVFVPEGLMAAETMRLYYIVLPTQLVNDSDSITFPVPVAQKLILAIVGRDVLDRQDLDPSPAVARIAQLTHELNTAADALDASEPFYIDADGPPPEFEEDLFY